MLSQSNAFWVSFSLDKVLCFISDGISTLQCKANVSLTTMFLQRNLVFSPPEYSGRCIPAQTHVTEKPIAKRKKFQTTSLEIMNEIFLNMLKEVCSIVPEKFKASFYNVSIKFMIFLMYFVFSLQNPMKKLYRNIKYFIINCVYIDECCLQLL